jgi:hypothetical protein
MTTILTNDLIPLPHLPRELGGIVEPGQDIPGHRDLYAMVTNGELPMIIFDRGRWKCPEPELPVLAQVLGLRLKPSILPPPADTAVKSKRAASKPARPRASTRRSAA